MAARGLGSSTAVLPSSPVAMASSLGPPACNSICKLESVGSPPGSTASSTASQSVNGKYYNPVVMDIIREDWIQQQLLLRRDAYTELRTTRVVVGTWNVNAKKPLIPAEASKIVQWLQPLRADSSKDPPDLVVLGFQEIVDLNAVNVVVNSALTVQRSAAWKETVLTALNHYVGVSAACTGASETLGQYRIVMEKHLVGILVLVFVRMDHWDHVKEIKGATAGVGIMGVMGNKGGAAVRVKFYSSTLCFVCAHLAAHRDNVAGRNADYLNVLNKIQFEEMGDEGGATPMHDTRFWNGSPSILNHDFVFWIGDLNYRIQDTLLTDEVFRLAESKQSLHELVQHDQLTKERRAGKVLQGFEEGPLTFPPTYKFQAGTSEYEKRPEKKLRAPAWCDRILWRAKHPRDVKLWSYTSVPALNLSDHKPVHAFFEIQVNDQVESKKNDVMRDIMMQLDKWENENMPKVRLLEDSGTIPSGGVFAFTELKYEVEQTIVVTIENSGVVVAHFCFVPKLDEVTICKPWLKVTPMFGMIPPREKMDICITALVDQSVAHTLTSGQDTLDDTMILRVENGRDYFLVVSGQYAKSCFGSSLEQLVSCSEPIRYAKFPAPRSPVASVFSVWVGGAAGVNANSLVASRPLENISTTSILSNDALKVPKELWRMVNDIYTYSMLEKNLFVEAGSKVEILDLREALDTGAPFSPHSGYSMAELLVRWLQSLQHSVVPDNVLAIASTNGNMAYGCRALLDGLSSVRYNVVLYLVSFLREVIKNSASNKQSPDKLAFVFSRCLVSPCTLHNGKDLQYFKLGRVLALNEYPPPNSHSSTASTVSSIGSNHQSTLPLSNKNGPPEERLRRDAYELEVAQTNATQRAEKMEKLLLHFLSVPMP